MSNPDQPPLDQQYFHVFHCDGCGTRVSVYVPDEEMSEHLGTKDWPVICPARRDVMCMDEVYGPKTSLKTRIHAGYLYYWCKYHTWQIRIINKWTWKLSCVIPCIKYRIFWIKFTIKNGKTPQAAWNEFCERYKREQQGL